MALDRGFVEAIAAGDDEHRRRLGEALRALPGPWAVRSSCASEDGSAASSATFAVRVSVCSSRVWASAYSPGVRAYRDRLGITAATEMAVVVQRLVDAEVAGVLFGGEDVLIEASWGLGEGVVAGTIEPDRYRLDDQGAVLEAHIADKGTELRRDPNGGTATRAVLEGRRNVACLTREQLLALTTLARRCARVFGGPRDIEWAIDGSGDLVCLQCRPITRATPARKASSDGVLRAGVKRRRALGV